MDIEKIREIVKIVEESSLTELSLKEGDKEIVLKRELKVGEAPVIISNNKEIANEEQEEEDEDIYIMSPMVGTFYNSPSPDVKAFVNVGDVVKAGETLCIIEAMKLMNEIDCEYDAEILSIMVSNEQKVEYGQPLFKVKKL